MKSLKEEDIYDWVKNYFPGYLHTDYDVDDLMKLYQYGKDILGKFEKGDIVSYDWHYEDSPDIYTAVVIFDSIKRDSKGNTVVSLSGGFVFKAFIADTNIYNIDDNQLFSGSDISLLEDMRLASNEEKIAFFEKLKKYSKSWWT